MMLHGHSDMAPGPTWIAQIDTVAGNKNGEIEQLESGSGLHFKGKIA